MKWRTEPKNKRFTNIYIYIYNQFEMFHKYACNCRAINNKRNVKKLDLSSFKIDEEGTTWK